MNDYTVHCSWLVSKETVVLCQKARGSETQKILFQQ